MSKAEPTRLPRDVKPTSRRNVIHVYAVHGEYRDLLDVFAEQCTCKRLLGKTKYLAGFYEATHIIVEDAARGSDLMDDLRADLAVPIIAANVFSIQWCNREHAFNGATPGAV